MKLKKLIGTRAFYASVLAISVPIMVRNGITTFVGLLDNIMIGQVGTEQMSGVAIANQLIFVYNLALFGIFSGASIYGAQFYGNKDLKNLAHTFRFKLLAGVLIYLFGLAVFTLWGEELVTLFLHEDESGSDLALALSSGLDYLRVMVVGLLPYAIGQAYASTLQETGETLVAMYAGIAGVLVNLGLNYVLIFGRLGFPALGVTGAALATVIARFVEMGVIVWWAHRQREKAPWLVGLYRDLRIPLPLVKAILVKGTPLAINEVLWSTGMTFLVQCYSIRGLEVVAAINITNTIHNVFSTVFMAIGNAVSILVGQQLGAGRLEKARETAYKTIAFAALCCLVMGTAQALTAPLFPRLYNTTDQVRELAALLLVIVSCFMPVQGILHSTYFTIRSGGKTMITLLFDSGFTWGLMIPVAFCLSRFTALPVMLIYIAVNSVELVKCVVGFALLKSDIWQNNMTQAVKAAP